MAPSVSRRASARVPRGTRGDKPRSSTTSATFGKAEGRYMKSLLKWGLIGLAGLLVLGALLAKDEKSGQPQKAATTGTAKAQEPAATATATREPAAAETATPEPTPPPEVSVSFAGPSSVHTDDVVLKGTVDPANAHVRVKGQSVAVRHGHWKLPVTLAKHGDNAFSVVATRKGFVKDTTTAVVTRKLSAAEKAVVRRVKAQRRANRRALESAESYLATSGFSKQGLYEQLSSPAGEGFTQAEAQYAVDHVDVDWSKEAVESARSYLDMSPMSRNALIEQLSSSAGEGFTYEQALYAVNKVY